MWHRGAPPVGTWEVVILKPTVKHLIVFNAPHVPPHKRDETCLALARQAREVLTRIPGVTDVAFGVAVSESPAYRYLLIVEFAEEGVIASYRDHPIHVRFADEVFRPLAVERITTDYRMLL